MAGVRREQAFGLDAAHLLGSAHVWSEPIAEDDIPAFEKVRDSLIDACITLRALSTSTADPQAKDWAMATHESVLRNWLHLSDSIEKSRPDPF